MEKYIQKETPSYLSKQLRFILDSIDKYVDHEYKIGDFIYRLLCDGYSKEEIVSAVCVPYISHQQIKEIPEEISLISQKILDYIDHRAEDEWFFNQFGFEAIEIFHICCLLDLQQTKKYYEIILDPSNSIIIALANKNYKINQIYQGILESYVTKEKLEREIEIHKEKYKLLETHLKYMPDGEGYMEAKYHFDYLLKHNL
jgi:hypothetical protein